MRMIRRCSQDRDSGQPGGFTFENLPSICRWCWCFISLLKQRLWWFVGKDECRNDEWKRMKMKMTTLKCESIVSQKTAVHTVRRWAATSEFPIYSLGDGQVGCQCLSCAVALKIHLSVCSFHSLTDLVGWVSFLPPEIQQNAIVFVVKAETVGCGNFSACTDINSSSDFIMVLVRSNLNGVYTTWLIVFIIGWMQSSKDFH